MPRNSARFGRVSSLLSQIYDPPVTLYVRGECPLDGEKMFSIVGSRRCTRDGQRAAREIAAHLAREDVTIVSGLARGVDTYAHQGALSVHGKTIAVLGSGPDVIYPPENDQLAEQILIDGGAILSEYPPGTKPFSGHFPARNRIISGLTEGTLLVEGGHNSGAMITVNDALDQNRDVFAVPGSIYSPLSEAPNKLIVDGARPVVSAWEILDHYRWAERDEVLPAKKPTIELSDEERSIVLPLTEQPLSFEEMRTDNTNFALEVKFLLDNARTSGNNSKSARWNVSRLSRCTHRRELTFLHGKSRDPYRFRAGRRWNAGIARGNIHSTGGTHGKQTGHRRIPGEG